MSAPAQPEPFFVMKFPTRLVKPIDDLTAAEPAENLDIEMLRTHYTNAINLAKEIKKCEDLSAHVETLSNERDSAVADLNAATTQLEQLRTQLNQTLTIAAAASANASGSDGGRKGQTDPEKFSGEDRGKLRSFLALLRLRLIDRPGEFPDEQSKLRYAFSWLEGPALEQMRHHIRDDTINLTNFAAFTQALEEAYDDPNRAATAERALANLKQGNREFVVYFAEFQRLMADLNWNDSAKKAALHRGLNPELKSILIHNDIPDGWNEYVALVKKRDMQYRAHLAETRHTGQGSGKSNPAPARSTPAASSAPAPPHPTTSGSGNYGPAPMDLSAARRQLSPEERQKHIDEGRCLYCGGFYHLARDCPNKGKTPAGRRPMRGAATAPGETPEVSESAPAAESGKV